MNSLRLLIVDDEPLIRAGIRNGLSSIEGIEIARESSSVAEAMQALESEQFDLVLLDVQMQDGTGLDVVQGIGPKRMPPVIFVTAYDEYAVKAFELNAVDYLLKPFDDERLCHSVHRAQERIAEQRQAALADHLQALLDTRPRRWPERIAVRQREQFDLVPVESIDWIESANNYVQLHCGPKQYLLGESLTHIESRLNPAKFLRIHRCRIVNLSRILAIHPMLSGTYEMELRSGIRLATGRQYKDAVQALLHN
ncbi:LytTR family DNA-binding domain-containing protein [Granulicella sp. dw_53]|uniref:LytR/AlgR family response regulator transcription factor n=1 Tax=Granulicella sp. dw_53 TaxID=2719792 RepID=UPI001BD26AE3|nr:LytTR family DNA-binding domain-containing protein [Granulicella sp. dw_53]